MTDTPPDIAQMVRDRLLARSGSDRFVMGTQMFEAARRMVLASFPPHLTETERRRLLFARIYGEPLPEPFGPGPDEPGGIGCSGGIS